MAEFVPFRPSSGFKAHLVEGAEAATASPVVHPLASEAQSGGAQAQSPVGPSRPDDGLPKSQEELQAVIVAAQTAARASAEDALRELKAEVEAERTALQCLMDGVDQARLSWAKEVRVQLGEVLLVGVRQIVAESATLQAEALKQRISEVGERLVGEQQVVMRVPAADVESAREQIAGREGWVVVADDDLVSGGLVAEAEGGQIDASMGAAFAGLSGSVKDWMDSAMEAEE